MSTPVTRTVLDRHMAAWRMYYFERRPTTAIAEHFGVSRQSIRNWLVSLGGQLDDDESERAFRDRIAVTLEDGQMLCGGCDIITDAHESGLCPVCRGDDEYDRETEREAEMALFTASAFLDNRRNIGRFDATLYHNTRGMITVW